MNPERHPRVPAAPLAVLALLLAASAAWFLFREHDASKAPAPGDAPPAALEPRAGAAGEAASVAARSERSAPVAFADEATCLLCHADQASAWRGSDHRLAMQPASADTVLGDFDDARFEDRNGVSRFYLRDGGFFVETAGPDGALAEFPVPYVFGVDPLQQVLLPLPGGRLQSFPIAWDVGGARWFSLYPDETIDARDELHWTRPAQNWNFTCAECHATDLRRGFDAATGAYSTTWNRLDVGCQACHGPASRHVEWATGEDADEGDRGFEAPITEGASSRAEVEVCARCHARRAPLGDGFDHRNRLMDDYLPALLGEGLYFADGQIQDEVYEYGSFLQSKMHARGVRCSDCHEPHSLAQRRPGNTQCATCHSPTPTLPAHVDARELARKNYDTPEHHRHAPGTPGSYCVDCHMAQRTYMVVDPRRDHSFRIPRPELSAELGAPDACTSCHAERDAAWAAAEIARWVGPRKPVEHFGRALHAGRTGATGAAEGLLALARSDAAPIVRASALDLLVRYPSQPVLELFSAGLADPDPLVRLAAASGFELLPPEERVAALAPRLSDEVRAVRLEACRQLAPVGAAALAAAAPTWQDVRAEYEAAQRALCDRPESYLNMALLHADLGLHAEAELELRSALRLDPAFLPAHVNLADLVRRTRGEEEAEALLREGLGRDPESAALHNALGLALVRQGRHAEGLTSLELAARLGPQAARFGYVHAVALHDRGRPDEARAVLARVLERHPGDRDSRLALAGYLREIGDDAGAERCLRELAAINPHDPALQGAFAAPGPGR